jgi:general secretion pathway protein J
MMETMLAVLLLGVILAALATITSQWLRNWDRGFDRIQGVDQLAAGLDRLVADLSSAEFITAGEPGDGPIFEGTETSVTFVRTPIGPNSYSGLELVRIAQASDNRGTAMVRTTAPFVPAGGAGKAASFANPVVLIRAPYRIAFSYSGPDRNWRGSWRSGLRLPRMVRLAVQGPSMTTSTIATVRAELPARCTAVKPAPDCEIEPAARPGSGG